ncbi:hypothetical protein NKOR_00495 [Candidatus Nitrosopumilus koreensis AR1]|uniref:N-acetyltransferase domain-containing protein n=1 Tax=Candidatus Nitrosopumilus koreensis AR1 TaxID=1229908 RepID=K0B6A8_9ARCH|nr:MULTISPECIES: hypothetical protein [Nitrosopumilus]AFS80021.1 hypothetical protein NKOR_00495 [Candidatus Nitrosopumilus koreensis AR1]
MNKIEFRDVHDDDWDFLVKIRNASHELHGNTSIFTKQEYKKYIENQLLENKSNRHWIIMYEDKMMGHAKIINQVIGYIFAPEFQGKGLLKFVFDKFETEVAKLGYLTMLGRVKITHPVSLWQCMKHGWKMVGLEMNEDPELSEYKLSKDIKNS